MFMHYFTITSLHIYNFESRSQFGEVYMDEISSPFLRGFSAIAELLV